MRILILSGGDLDQVFACSYIKEWNPDKVIAADSGLLYAKQLGIQPDIILGDFDSCDKRVMDQFSTEEKMLFPCEKDDTDTGLAMQKAMEMGADEVLLFGATGTRIDHMLGNIGQLVFAFQQGVKATIIDRYNRLRILEDKTVVTKKEQFGKYISLIPIDRVEGVTLTGFHYPLKDDTLVFHETWGISNELEAEEGIIQKRTGTLLMIESQD